MNGDRRAKISKVAQLGTVIIFSFQFGIATEQFRGDGWSWAAVILGVVIIAIFSYLLLRDFWKPHVSDQRLDYEGGADREPHREGPALTQKQAVDSPK